MQLFGIDLGKGYTKGYDGKMLKTLPSVIGHPEKIKYQDSLKQAPSPTAGIHINTPAGEFYVGDLALNQSSLSWTMMDRSDVADQMKLVLTLAVLSEFKASGPVKIVTGVPVDWFGQKDQVIDLLRGEHTYTRDGKHYTVDIQEVIVVTEPHGTIYSKVMDQTGQITNMALAGKRIGVIDVGMYTTDFLVLEKLGYLEPASGSLQSGMSQVYEIVGRRIQHDFGLDLEPHQIDRHIRSGKIDASGQEYSLVEIVEPALQGLSRKITARATQLPSSLWKDNGAALIAIYLSGGGAHHIGAYLSRTYPHAEILAGSATANVRGFYNGAVYKWGAGAKKTKAKSTRAKSLNGAMANGG